jgi:murein DD-endopeptidase MepM/ murein hydrolase activator NlpD
MQINVLERGRRYQVRQFIRNGERLEEGQYVGLSGESLLIFGLATGEHLHVAPMDVDVTPVG